MAASSQSPIISNTITGKVTLKESGVGIPDLLVVIYDIGPGTKPQENFSESSRLKYEKKRNDTLAPLPETETNLNLGDRIGSVITAQDGSWSLRYEDTEFRILNPPEKRPDLQLLVLAPEDSDSDKPPIVLFSSKVLRINSGRIESYLIRILTQQLIDANISIPLNRDDEKDDNISKSLKYREKKIAQRDLRDRIKEVNKEFDDQDFEQTNELRNTIKAAILPNAEILNSMYNFVKDTDNIEVIQKAVFKNGSDNIENKINNIDENNPIPGKGIKISLVLTEEEKKALEEYKFMYKEKTYYKIPEFKIQELLFKRETDGGINTILFSNNPISKFCIQKSTNDKCAEEHTGLTVENNENSEPVVSEQAKGITKEDIPFFLEKILVAKDSNQFQNLVDYKSQRPNAESVQANVSSFSLQKGPADTTAFYDFHSLQIAFQYVWHQLLDETLVNLSEKIDKDLENSGKKGLGQAIKGKTIGNVGPGFQTVLSAIDEACKITKEEVPTDISAAFDISFIEYDALSADDKPKLESLAKDINNYESPQPSTTTTSFFGGVIETTKSTDYSTLVGVLRDQGERIIDNIRVNKPYTTNQLLKELQERLLSKYEFTVFAADKNYHSINFGLMNTFRQKWEPISYQAGKLVKTIPLTPKEERKYSVKTTVNAKITRKQAQKYNTSLQQEINTTSRAESEIVAKAHDKSNFNMSVKLDYSSISSELSYGKEAEKDSSQSKKDFREAVIKAAQEFKEERSLEIYTEENINSEYNESGTITNPNEELACTCLCYELQRRYRLSEQLYRVMPVVLVAQEVPSPDQITEAWIIAHDWIINRVLLDDSFRNTLQYIAQKNVGDDFAIRELRKNLRQQRSLVNSLQIEFSKLKQDVENKYSAMESALQNRISQEHFKRTYRWWWWWDQPNRPDTPPDPEMAKAQEQAATDEHKYAVEKAEKMSLSVQREVNALHQLTTDYNNVMQEHLDRITQTRRLITHIKENILYYMQAIWSMEPPDQRFMRLYKVMIPHFEATRTCIVEDQAAEDIFAQFREEGKQKHNGWLHGKINRNADGQIDLSYKQLVEVADLDTILGFKGNYMIFPLKEHNALTELMAAPYIDEAFGAMDPDQLSNINLEEFSKYICCLHHEKPKEYERLKPVLRKWLEMLLADPLRNGDEIIVPTGSLFIELLPSDKPLLEEFKLKHREWDVYRVQAEVRKLELENIRYAARLLNAEMEDPDIEKKIVVSGNGMSANLDVDNI